MDDINKKSNDNVEIAITNSFCLSMCVSCFHLNSCVKLHIHLKYFNWESSKISGREREREINVGMEIQNIQLNMKHTMKEVNVHSVSQQTSQLLIVSKTVLLSVSESKLVLHCF